MNKRHGLFRRNQTVVDLGYAPGSWSQVAKDATAPNGVVVGIDLIPAQPPRGVTSIQGDFLSPHVRALVKDVLVEQVGRRERDRKERLEADTAAFSPQPSDRVDTHGESAEGTVLAEQPSYIDQEKQATLDIEAATSAEEEGRRMVDVSCARGPEATPAGPHATTPRPSSQHDDALLTHDAQVVISDMLEPWPQTSGFSIRTLSNPYRLMNTSGIKFNDHAGSMVRESPHPPPPPPPNTTAVRRGSPSHKQLTWVHQPGPLLRGPDFCLGHAQGRGALRLQVLPGSGGQEAAEAVGEDVLQGTPGETRIVEECMLLARLPERSFHASIPSAPFRPSPAFFRPSSSCTPQPTLTVVTE